jgi:hypothetical protein
MTVSKRLALESASLLVVLILPFHINTVPALGAEGALKLRGVPVGAAASERPLTIDLFRWSTDAERNPMLAALAPPPPAPAAAAAPPADAGRGGAGRAGRGAAGRGGRGGQNAAPLSPAERLTRVVKAAPTIGFIWGGVTGYSIKYAWHAPAADGGDRVVLVTDRRLDTTTAIPGDASAGEFTVIEIVLDAKGTGEAKSSLTNAVVVDAGAKTLAIDGYRTAPLLLKVSR